MRKPDQTSQQDVTLAVRHEDALRCCCGSLLARLVPAGVELKCRRCKRQIIVPLTLEKDAKSRSTVGQKA
ncbi:MAG: hypothetical protein ACREQO_24530 [Candidatus Binatia bacterium]